MQTKRRHVPRAAARTTAAVVLWSLCVITAASETIDGRFERAFAVDGDTLVLDVRTGSGRIAVTAGEPGRVRVSGRIRTGSGAIRVERFEATLRARTGSGPIQAAGAPGGAWHLTTGSGGIDVDLSDEAAFEIDARTRSGAVRCDHPVAVHDMRRGRLQGRVRSGGPLITLRTGSGNIDIH